MQVIFSGKIVQFLHQDLICVYNAAQKLQNLRLDDLNFGFGKQKQGIKRLFFDNHRNIPLWRYRQADWRVVFWAGLKDYKETAIIWLAGHRREVYETLSRKLPAIHSQIQDLLSQGGDPEELEVWEDALEPPLEELSWQEIAQTGSCFHWPDQIGSEKEVVNFIHKGLFRFHPVLNTEQKHLVQQVEGIRWTPNNSFILPLQGGAGTGKTTVGVEIVRSLLSSDNNLYPLLILPNPTLVHKTQAALLSALPNCRMATNWQDRQDTQGLVTTRDQLLQSLAGDQDPPLSLPECNRRLQDHLCSVAGGKTWGKTNLYGLLRGYSSEALISYPSNYRDLLTQQYAVLNHNLQSVWRPRYEAIFEGRDPYAQAQRALLHLNESSFSSNSVHRYVLIVDEIQDYYWFYLRVLFHFSQTIGSQSLLVLLGDENQRVTISGFTWAALANVMQSQLDILLPPRIELTENFRNTVEIARVARHTLLQGFRHLVSHGGRHPQDPGLPSSGEHGAKPRLQVIRDDTAFFDQIPTLLANEDPEKLPPNYVFILNPNSNWKSQLHSFDPKEDLLIPYTIPEAKGQEFDAVIWVHPFLDCGDHLDPDQIFQWYTTITRARTYQVWMLSPTEYDWLTQQANRWSEPLNRLFTNQALSIPDLISELRQQARTQLTLEQRRQRALQQFYQSLQEWLMGSEAPPLPNNLAILRWNFWEFLAALCQNNPELERLENLSFQDATLPGADPLQTTLLFWICYKWAQQTGLSVPVPWQAHALQSFQTYLTQHPDQKEIALTVEDPEWQSFVYWASGSSWQAAIHINQHFRQHHFQKNQAMVRAISHHLNQRGLSLEAQRLLVSLELAAPPPDLLAIPELWDSLTHTPTTVTRLCRYLVRTLIENLPKT